jgi:hypothetical protein
MHDSAAELSACKERNDHSNPFPKKLEMSKYRVTRFP